MSKCLIPLAALALAAACSTKADQADRQDTAGGAATGAVAATPAASPSAPALDDATIVAIFDAANSADIETGELAAERGSTKAVRDFGAMLARDHRAVRQQGRDLAQRLGVAPTPPANDPSARAHAEAMATLRSKQGAEFDRAFLEHEVEFHQNLIDAIQGTLLPAIRNQELRDLVVKVAPAFQAHRDMAANLRQKVRV